MRTTIDKAGRIVIPKDMRDALGLLPGPVDVVLAGNVIQIEVPEPPAPELVEKDGIIVVRATGTAVTDDDVRKLRDAQLRY